jgi:protein TonB
MKIKALLFSVFLLSLNFGSLNAQNKTTETNTSEAESNADQLPEFPGGVVAMMNYVKANIKYPQRALDAKISGKCQLKFTVQPDGSIDEITVLDGMTGCPECEAEAIRVVKSMPKWKPGKLAGKPVALFYNLPISFSLPKK